MSRIEYSTTCFDSENYRSKIERARERLAGTRHTFGVQLHNSIDRDLFTNLLPFAKEIPFSIHAPLFATRFINLAASEQSSTDTELAKTLEVMAQVGCDILFFHGFFLTENPIPHDMRNYRTIMKRSMQVNRTLGDGFIMDPAVFSETVFSRFKRNFVTNLQRLKNLHPNLTIALENDYPGLGSGLTRPQEIAELLDNVWLDVGHLWCASIVHRFDFSAAIMDLAKTRKIVGVHLNHNLTPQKASSGDIKDSHAHLYLPTQQDLRPLVKLLAATHDPIFTLEIVDGDERDLEIILDWLG